MPPRYMYNVYVGFGTTRLSWCIDEKLWKMILNNTHPHINRDW